MLLDLLEAMLIVAALLAGALIYDLACCARAMLRKEKSCQQTK